MRAAVLRRYGPPSAVSVEDVPTPTPGDGELLVKVSACTVNRTDCGYRAASPPPIRLFSGLRRPRRAILGTEYAGEVVALGPGATRFAVGDRVFGYNEGPFGTHAQYLAVAETASIAAVPDGVDLASAAAATEGAHYANVSLAAARVSDGQQVLIHGATGAIGSAAVQLAVLRGAAVTAVCGTDHLDLVAGLGAERVVDYQTSDPTVDDQRYDFIFDAVGKESFGRYKALLKPDGIYTASELGRFAQLLFFTLSTRVTPGPRAIFVLPRHDQAMVERFAGYLADGSFRPLIDRHYPLDEIADAYRYVESGQKVGNVIVDPW